MLTMKMKEFTKDEKDQILAQSEQFWEESTEWMSPYFELVNELERLSRVLLPADLAAKYDQFQERSALVPPDIYNNLNSLRAFIRGGLFRKKPFMRLNVKGKPFYRGEEIQKADQILQAIMDEESDGKGFASEADLACHQALYGGLSAAYTYWHEEWERVVERDPETLQIKTNENGEPIFTNEITAAYPATIALDIRRMRMNKNASKRKDIMLVGYHHLESESSLIEKNDREKNHYNFKESDLVDSSFDTLKFFEYVPSDGESAPDKDRVGDKLDYTDDQVEVRSIRGKYQLKDKNGKKRIEDLIVEIGNATILMAAKRNDLPIAGYDLFDWPAVDEQHGLLFTMGVIEAGRDVFLEQFVKRNQSMDAANRNVYVTMIGDSAACEDLPEYLDSSQDRILKVDTMAAGLTDVRAALAVLDRPALGQDTFMHSQVCRKDLQTAMRLSDYLQGQTPDTTESATGVHEIVTGGKSLTEFLIEKLTDTFFRPCALKKMKLWNFYMAHKEQVIYSSDGTPFNLAPGEIDLPFGASIQTNLSVTNPAMVRRFVEALPLMLHDPYYDQMVVRETAIEVLDLPNKDRLLVNQEYLEFQIDKENAALGMGIEQPVHPLEPHTKHMEGHVAYMDEVGETPLMIQHITAHQAEIEKQSGALGNTKEMGGGAGNLVQPEGARIKPSGGGKTGNFTASESRR